jgi:hypothetical protein
MQDFPLSQLIRLFLTLDFKIIGTISVLGMCSPDGRGAGGIWIENALGK